MKSNEELLAENLILRKEYWMLHCNMVGHDLSALYGDDGELQCSSCDLDFKRDDIYEIVHKLFLKMMDKIDVKMEA
jgi:hypothetical protein